MFRASNARGINAGRQEALNTRHKVLPSYRSDRKQAFIRCAAKEGKNAGVQSAGRKPMTALARRLSTKWYRKRQVEVLKTRAFVSHDPSGMHRQSKLPTGKIAKRKLGHIDRAMHIGEVY